MSLPFSIDESDAKHIAKVAAYSIGATLLSCIALFLANAKLPVEWLFLVPMINTAIVAGERWARDSASKESGKIKKPRRKE